MLFSSHAFIYLFIFIFMFIYLRDVGVEEGEGEDVCIAPRADLSSFAFNSSFPRRGVWSEFAIHPTEAKWEAGRVVGREAAGGRGGGSKIPAQFCFVCFRSNCFFVYFFLCSLLSWSLLLLLLLLLPLLPLLLVLVTWEIVMSYRLAFSTVVLPFHFFPLFAVSQANEIFG